MSSFFLLISYIVRDVWRSRTLFFLIVSGLSVVSAALLLTMGFLNGFQTMLADGEQGWLSDIVITPAGDDRSIAESSRLEDELRVLPDVEAFSMRSQGQTVVRYKERDVSPFLIIGLDTASTEQTTTLSSRVIEGEFFQGGIEYPDEVVLGKTMGDALEGGADDGKMIPIGEIVYTLGTNGESKRFRVRGIIDTKSSFSNWNIYVMKKAYEGFDAAGRNTSMVIKLKPGADMLMMVQTLKDRFPRATVKTWEEESKYVQGIMQAVVYITQSIYYLLVLTIFTIVSVVIYINISQKKRQIGILKSMGAKNSFVLAAYLLESCLYAGIASVIGFLFFFLMFQFSVSHPIPMLIGDFRISFSWDILLSSCLTIFIATISGGMIPALIAARMHIVDVMRGTV